MYKSEGEWTRCFEVSDIKLPTVVYLGFSAETGELSDNFDIISVDTNNLYDSGNTGGSRKSPSSRKKGKKSDPKVKEGGSWSWFLLKVVLFFAVCGGGYLGWTFYRTSRRSSRF